MDFHHACKGRYFFNFLFAYLDDKTLQKDSLLMKEQVCISVSKLLPLIFVGASSFFLDLTSFDKGSQN